jgi:hypothetical protein
MSVTAPLPPELEAVREKARRALQEVPPAGPPRSGESKALLLSSRTNGGRSLPEYYLVYFLLVDLLGYYHLGQWEKVAWVIPIRYRDRLYSIEYRKFGIGIFAPNHDPKARMSTSPSEEAESDAQGIAAAIQKATTIAGPYFEWRAEQAVSTSHINVINANSSLYNRYIFFRDKFFSLEAETKAKDKWNFVRLKLADGSEITTGNNPAYHLRREAEWIAQAAIDAFFSWTEHVFIHIAAIQGRICTGDEVAALAESDWKTKFKTALDLTDIETKCHYDTLLDLRVQIRNFMAHGAFGKRGEAFRFHSDAGAVPVLLSQSKHHKYAMTAKLSFDESTAIKQIETFIEHLWSGCRAPAKTYIFSDLPMILTYTIDGTYAQAMQSEQDMAEFVEHMTRKFDNAANMDW